MPAVTESRHTITLAIDAMSGDRGPGVVVAGALDAVRDHKALKLILVGNQDELRALLRSGADEGHPRIEIEHAPDVVGMGERPSRVLRQKQQSSMARALELVRDQRAQACVSAGNTGALMALGRYILKTFPGIDRPAIAKSVPGPRGECLMLDLGANVDASADHLFQFAQMGAVAAAGKNGSDRPRVALLNVGEEEIKGREEVRLASHMLAQSSTVNYIGYIEGSDLFRGVADVVVCDGFVGNVALKTGEGVATLLINLIEDAFREGLYGRLVGALAKPMLARIVRKVDPHQYNGACLLGLQGVVIKSHGNASERGIVSAICQAADEVRSGVTQRMGDRLDDLIP